MKSKHSTPPSYRWVCIDEQASWNGEDQVGRFVVDVAPCPAPCDAAQRKGTRFYHLAMSHFWHKDRASALNSQVIVLDEGPMKDKIKLQKVVNDVRANTP